MKTVCKLIIFASVFFVLTERASAQSLFEELPRLAAELRKNPTDKVLQERVAKIFAELDAQLQKKPNDRALLEKYTKMVAEMTPSVKRGDLPPEGAFKMTPGIARIVARDLLKKRYLPSATDKTFYRLYFPGVVFFESKAIRVTRDSLSFEFDVFADDKRMTHRPTLLFRQLDYFVAVSPMEKLLSFSVVWPVSEEILKKLSSQFALDAFAWAEERDARRFCEALNLLIYEAHHGGARPDEMMTFVATAKNWREKPESRPKPPDGWERHRILAEQNISDRDPVVALQNYEAGIEAFPMWPEGWFNAALMYDALEEYEYAANRMKHYLELMPDAPDAKAAREKIIIWEEKAKR